MNTAVRNLHYIMENPTLKKLYTRINPILFDVSLRDGIQTMESIETFEKMNHFNKIMREMTPMNIEVGALVSSKIMPIMKDTPKIYKECIQMAENLNSIPELRDGSCKEIGIPNIYVLIPGNKGRYKEAIELGIKNISIMSSVSESFMKKNVKMSIDDFKRDLSYFNGAEKLKIYLSCINECPIEGKMDLTKIIDEILYYNENPNVTEICLSDTCGTLTYTDFKKILQECKDNNIGMDLLSLHLHINNYKDTSNIIKHSLYNNINKFDVSAINGGGCKLTIANPEHNLTYNMFYDILLSYMSEVTPNPPNDKCSNYCKEKKLKYVRCVEF